MLGAINVGTYYFFMGAFGTSYFGLTDTTVVRIVFLVVITGAQALVNHMGIGLTAKLTDFSGYLIFATAIVLAAVCLLAAPSYDIGRLFTFANYSGEAGGNVWPATSGTWVFLLGLLLPIYTITGYDASAHTSEETVKAAHSVPRGMVVVGAVVGALRLHHALRVRADAAEHGRGGQAGLERVLLGDGQRRSTLSSRIVLYLAIFVSQWLCGLATVTSVSRMIFAFSRDGGLPASKALAKVSPKYRTPVAAIWTGSILSVLFVWGSSLVSIGETPVYTIVVSCTVIFLFFSFAIPITLGLFAWGTSKWDKMGPWNLGEGMFKLFAVLSILAMILIFVLGIQPPNEWALYITVGFLVADRRSSGSASKAAASRARRSATRSRAVRRRSLLPKRLWAKPLRFPSFPLNGGAAMAGPFPAQRKGIQGGCPLHGMLFRCADISSRIRRIPMSIIHSRRSRRRMSPTGASIRCWRARSTCRAA